MSKITLKSVVYFWQEIIFFIVIGLFLFGITISVPFDQIHIFFYLSISLLLCLVIQFLGKSLSFGMTLATILGFGFGYLTLKALYELSKITDIAENDIRAKDEKDLYVFVLCFFGGLTIIAISMFFKYFIKWHKLAWYSKNEKRAVKAVNKLKDEVKLIRAAKEARCHQAILVAIDKLTDQNVLADFAINTGDWSVCFAAVEKLTDQNALACVAKTAHDSAVREATIKKLTDQNVLTDIAKNDKDSAVRKAAIAKLTDSNVLLNMARNDFDINIRIAAAHRLVDFSLDEELILDLIGKLGNELRNSENSEKTRVCAADAVMAFFRRYERKEIREYEGKYSGGYSDHNDHHYDNGEDGYCCQHEDSHTDDHTDTTYSFDVKFTTEAT